ncbi:MAG: hypothetical protein KA715_13610 [Xanthomonadaceae bacterium]|nr:hypothetical protein [Xanthomonadaceae bacterium]
MKKIILNLVALYISTSPAFADYSCKVNLNEKDSTESRSETMTIKVSPSIFESTWTPFEINSKEFGLIKGDVNIFDSKGGSSPTRPYDGVFVNLRIDRFKEIRSKTKNGRFAAVTFSKYDDRYITLGINRLYLECLKQ